jgi:hypothetical protein
MTKLLGALQIVFIFRNGSKRDSNVSVCRFPNFGKTEGNTHLEDQGGHGRKILRLERTIKE